MRRVEAVLPVGEWRKSSYSGSQGSCVEVAPAPDVVGVRDTKDRDGGILPVSGLAWQAFTARV